MSLIDLSKINLDTINYLKSENFDLTQEIKTVKSRNDVLNAEVEILNSSNVVLKSKYNDCQSIIANLNTEIENLKLITVHLNIDIDNWKKNNDNLKDEIEMLKVNNDNLHVEREMSQQSKKYSCVGYFDKLRFQIEALKSQNVCLNIETEMLKSQNVYLNSELLKLRKIYLKSDEPQYMECKVGFFDKLKTDIEMLNWANVDWKNVADLDFAGKLKSEIEILVSKNDKLKSEIKTLISENGTLKFQIGVLDSDNCKLKYEVLNSAEVTNLKDEQLIEIKNENRKLKKLLENNQNQYLNEFRKLNDLMDRKIRLHKSRNDFKISSK